MRQGGARNTIKNIGILFSGNVIAQALNFCLLPVISIIYSPATFGVFAIYWQLVSIFSAVACGKYDSALILPEQAEEAQNLFLLSFIALIMTSLVILIPAIFFRQTVGNLMKVGGDLTWILLVPLGVFAAGFFQLLSNWALRQKTFYRISSAQMTQSLLTNIFKVILGGLKNGALGGLVWAKIFGDLCACLNFIRGFNVCGLRSFVRRFNLDSILSCALKYSRFPKLSAPAKFLNLVVVAIPSFLLMRLYSDKVVGNYFMAYNLIIIPISMLGSAIGGGVANELAQLRNDPGRLKDAIKKIHIKLLIYSFLPVVLVWVFIGFPIRVFFDEKWINSVSYIRILLPAMYILFLNTPFFQVIDALGRQRFFLTYNAELILIRGGAIWIGACYWNDPLISLGLFSVTSVITGIYFYYKILGFATEGALY